jgi:mannan endo-1,4-beta-mannosidase
LADIQRSGRHRQASQEKRHTPARQLKWLATISAVSVVIAIIVALAVNSGIRPERAAAPSGRPSLSPAPGSYIGLYAPESFAQVRAFTAGTGIKPRVLVYYSGWQEPFRVGFAQTAAKDGAVPLVQMNPTDVSIAAIAAGRYDGYLSAYAKTVRAYHRPVILSFGHEMNGYWYSWGYRHTSPAVFVAGWRHIVHIFRALGARNVTWLWTVNNIHKQSGVPSPDPWWPGDSYVNWVGIDGYYTNSSSVFTSVFGPTIVAVRALTRDPILIAETSAAPASGQPAKIANLFAGVHLYGLLGFVWFDSLKKVDWRLNSPEAIAAFRRSARTYLGLAT